MSYNIVRNPKTNEILYETREGLGNAVDWMMSRVWLFNTEDFDEIAVEAVSEDGEVTGWWTIDDIFWENDGSWQLEDGRVILDPRVL